MIREQWAALSLPLKIGYLLAALAIVGLVWLVSVTYLVTY